MWASELGWTQGVLKPAQHPALLLGRTVQLLVMRLIQEFLIAADGSLRDDSKDAPDGDFDKARVVVVNPWNVL